MFSTCSLTSAAIRANSLTASSEKEIRTLPMRAWLHIVWSMYFLADLNVIEITFTQEFNSTRIGNLP